MKDADQKDLLSEKLSNNVRLNLNELLKRRSEEKKRDSKTNLTIFFGAGIAVLIVLLILNI